MKIVMYDVKLKLSKYLVKVSYQLFIEPLELVSQNDDEIILKASNEWCKSIIEDRFMPTIQMVIDKLAGMPMKISIII